MISGDIYKTIENLDGNDSKRGRYKTGEKKGSGSHFKAEPKVFKEDFKAI